MSEFEKRYKALNVNQKKAVDTLDGPVMVVAGPGTGKTELLSVRVANILQKTDTLPQNILCLTFTDSAATNMRERLEKLLGPDAYKVAVHTFHSFGSEIINRYGEYFYQGARFRPADELSSYDILSDLLEKLPYDNPLSSKMNDRFTHLGDIQITISELKRGGLNPDELDSILEHNDAFLTWVKPKLAEIFAEKISKKTVLVAQQLIGKLVHYEEKPLELTSYHPLSKLFCQTLQRAIDDALETNSTKPLTAWKNLYLEKDAHGNHTLKDEKRGVKLHALSKLYADYLLAMQQAELYDYDDMILRVVHALELFDDLRFSLQEQYQYILVDEFQDTNDAQMRLIWNLTNNPVTEGRPNLMVVGDDDQAIYRFQGAELSNILDFTERYRDVVVVTLNDNYRSNATILDLARSVIVQARERLEYSLENVSKVLVPHHSTANASVGGVSYETTAEARAALAQQIAADSKNSTNNSRAIIARHHRELVELLPHLASAGVAVHYERQENVLDSEPVRILEQTAHVVWHLSQQEFDAANEHLAEVLAHPAWEVSAKDIWNISIAAHRQKKYWLEVMLEMSERLQQIAEWFIVGSARAAGEPLEYMLDYLFGVGESTDFSSPYKDYFFAGHDHVSANYLSHLSALQKIRAGIREYKPGVILKLGDFIEYLDLHHELELGISATNTLDSSTTTVTLLSAHKAKGLEFDTVYLTDALETVWGNGARSRSRLLRFPSNLPLSPAGDTSDERLRLLYVALTRARNRLTIISARTNEQNKALLPIGAFSGTLEFQPQPAFETEQAASALQTNWYTPLLLVSETDKNALLRPLLKRYKLNATHLNNYLDVAKRGPEYFLLHNLLRIPEAMSPSAAYGSMMHATLQHAHQHFAAHKQKRPVEDILHDFEAILGQAQLSELDHKKYLERGIQALTVYFNTRYDSFTPTQQVERDFSNDHVVVDGAALSGKVDLLDIDHDEKTIFITDYKTGKAATSWRGGNDYEKTKLHHYEQQLMMYKLLIENSRQFTGYTVTGARLEFVEPDPRGEIVLLDYVYDDEKTHVFEKLLSTVWNKIQSLEFEPTDDYEASFKGILSFENDLLTK